MTDYIAVDGKLRNDVFDAKIVRIILDGSDHSAVFANMKMRER